MIRIAASRLHLHHRDPFSSGRLFPRRHALHRLRCVRLCCHDGHRQRSARNLMAGGRAVKPEQEQAMLILLASSAEERKASAGQRQR
jgi:hypothetical protein